MVKEDKNRLVAYLRVSTSEQADSGLGLEAQKRSIKMAAKLHGWEIVKWIEDAGVSGASKDRPGWNQAINMVYDGQADGIVAAKFDRMFRSMAAAVQTLADANEHGWTLVALDLQLDTSTPMGEFVAHIMAALAHMERRMISTRTKEALAALKAQGKPITRQTSVTVEVSDRILDLHEAGKTYSQIAGTLRAEGILSPSGMQVWNNTSIRRVILAGRRGVAA